MDDLYVTTYNRDNVRWMLSRALNEPEPVSYTHLTLPTTERV